MKYKKHNRDVNQNGIRNPSAKFTIEDIENIIKRKKNDIIINMDIDMI